MSGTQTGHSWGLRAHGISKNRMLGQEPKARAHRSSQRQSQPRIPPAGPEAAEERAGEAGSPPSEMWMECTVADEVSRSALPWPMYTCWSRLWPGFQGCSSGLWSGHLATTVKDRERSRLPRTDLTTDHSRGGSHASPRLRLPPLDEN